MLIVSVSITVSVHASVSASVSVSAAAITRALPPPSPQLLQLPFCSVIPGTGSLNNPLSPGAEKCHLEKAAQPSGRCTGCARSPIARQKSPRRRLRSAARTHYRYLGRGLRLRLRLLGLPLRPPSPQILQLPFSSITKGTGSLSNPLPPGAEKCYPAKSRPSLNRSGCSPTRVRRGWVLPHSIASVQGPQAEEHRDVSAASLRGQRCWINQHAQIIPGRRVFVQTRSLTMVFTIFSKR